MRITMLGTGHALVTKCYNTCFVIDNEEEYFLVDGGGGNEILRILESREISLTKIHNIFVSHAHTDHVFGVIWVIRKIGQLMNQGKYEGALIVYCHEELKGIILSICEMVLDEKVLVLFQDKIILSTINSGDKLSILGTDVKVFDVESVKMKQYGFIMEYYEGKRLVFCGDEPLPMSIEKEIDGCDWLMHEAFCCYEDKDIFKPYEKCHSTVKNACELAERLRCKNLLLYHTEDTNLQRRKELYKSEGIRYYTGNLMVPNDGESIVL